jgi:hypothetical protein
MRKLAEAGVKVLGTDEEFAELFEHSCRPGNWLACGGFIALIAMLGADLNAFWTFAIVMVAGFAANEWERRKIRKRVRRQTPSTGGA